MNEARLTHVDVAERLNLPVSTVVELRKREGWPHVRLGKAVRFTEEQVEDIVRSHTVDAPDDGGVPVFAGQRPSRAKRGAA